MSERNWQSWWATFRGLFDALSRGSEPTDRETRVKFLMKQSGNGYFERVELVPMAELTHGGEGIRFYCDGTNDFVDIMRDTRGRFTRRISMFGVDVTNEPHDPLWVISWKEEFEEAVEKLLLA